MILTRRVSLPLCLLLSSITVNVLAEGRPQPLPRPEMKPLPLENLQRIQGISQAVLAANHGKTPNPKALELRQALLDMRSDIGEMLALGANGDLKVCAEAECTKNSLSNPKTERMANKRKALAARLASMGGDAETAHLIARVRELDNELGEAMQSDDLVKLRSLYDQLEPKSLQQMNSNPNQTADPTFHTITQHRPGIKGLNP